MARLERSTPMLRRGAEIRQPPTTFDWGLREMNVGDPDGHRLRFGTTTDGPPDGVELIGD